MAFTQFGFIQVDPNAPDSTTCQTLTERHQSAGLAVFFSVMCLMGKKSDRDARITFVAREIASMAGCTSADAIDVLKTWTETSEARGDGFRFSTANEKAGTWECHWPEFEERHSKIYSNRRNGDKPKASQPEATDKPTGSQPEATGKQSRVEKSKEENTTTEKLTPARALEESASHGGLKPLAKSKPTKPIGQWDMTLRMELIPAISDPAIAGPSPDDGEANRMRLYLVSLLEARTPPAKIIAAIKSMPEHYGSVTWPSIRNNLANRIAGRDGPAKGFTAPARPQSFEDAEAERMAKLREFWNKERARADKETEIQLAKIAEERAQGIVHGFEIN